jgi:glycosyltransferase involved in cell wall biosynthesis
LVSGGAGAADPTMPSSRAEPRPIVANPGISIVVPAFHAKDTIQRALDSVAQQRGVETEIIVIIDDGCLETQQRIEQLGISSCRVLMNEQNLGSQASRNRGLAEATQPFVLFLDADDFQSGDLLRGLVDAAQKSEADLVLGPWRILTSGGELLPIRVTEPASAQTIFWRWLVHGKWVSPTAVLWRTDYVRMIGGWDLRVRRHQDAEIALRAIARGARLGFSSEGAGVYVQHDSEHRITRSTGYDAQLDVAEFLLDIDGAIPRSTQEAAISRYLYRMAVLAFRRGDDDFGMRALARSRQLGFHGHLGRIARLGSALLGTRRYHRWAPQVRRQLGFR